jgi:uncharacterized membrane protein YccC
MNKKNIFFIVLLLLFVLSATTVVAEDDDLEIFGLEVEKLLNVGSGILATVLCILTLVAYRRVNNRRYLFVAIAFLLFAVKAFLMGSELVFDEWEWIDPVIGILDFGILASFFAGILNRNKNFEL